MSRLLNSWVGKLVAFGVWLCIVVTFSMIIVENSTEMLSEANSVMNLIGLVGMLLAAVVLLTGISLGSEYILQANDSNKENK